jgi:hypothetical protein
MFVSFGARLQFRVAILTTETGAKMMHQVVATFDLSKATSHQYTCVRDGLHELGLHTTVEGDQGQSQLPENTFYGEISGTDAASTAGAVREAVMDVIHDYAARGPVFVAVGGPDLQWEADEVRGTT